MAAYPTQFASVASLSASAPLLGSGPPKPSTGPSGSPSGLELHRPGGIPSAGLGPGGQGVYTSAAQYSPTAAGLLAYSRLAPGFTDTMYGASFGNPAAGIYGLGADPSALYVNPLTGTPYDLKENAEIWRNLSQQATCFAYDPTGLYSYGYGGMDLSLAARRKNATKENTGTLKAWLQEHKKNPYPTKGEKIMLAIITKMTLTQVSTWFANARRRLKKDNKMTWSPRNKTDSDDDDDDNNDHKEASSTSAISNGDRHELRDDDDDRDDGDAGQVDVTGCDSDDEDAVTSLRTSQADPLRLGESFRHDPLRHDTMRPADAVRSADPLRQPDPLRPGQPATTVPVLPRTHDSRTPSPTHTSHTVTTPTSTRPRIWSLADVLGPSTTSGSSQGADTRTTSVTAGSVVTSGLSYPMPLKPTASSALQGYCSPTAASLRHWADRSPYPIPVSLAGLPGPFLTQHSSRPNGLTGDRPSMNGTSGLPGFTTHPGLPGQYGLHSDRLRSHPSASPEEPGEIRKHQGAGGPHPGAGPHPSSPSTSSSPSPGAETPLSLTAFKPVHRSKPMTFAES